MGLIQNILTAITNIFTIIASVIAIYIFVVKRKVISSVFRVLLNFSLHMTLAEFKTKLERLNELSADDNEQRVEVINIFNDILGQIRGSKQLSRHFIDVVKKVASIAEERRQITEPKKRAIVSELRERLRYLNVDNYSDMIGK